MQQDYDNGKYTVIFDRETGELRAMRNGEIWQDLSGNKLVYWMFVEHKRALERIAELLEASKTALAEAESWIRDQLEGTQSYKSAMAKLDPVREAITKVEAAE